MGLTFGMVVVEGAGRLGVRHATRMRRGWKCKRGEGGCSGEVCRELREWLEQDSYGPQSAYGQSFVVWCDSRKFDGFCVECSVGECNVHVESFDVS